MQTNKLPEFSVEEKYARQVRGLLEKYNNFYYVTLQNGNLSIFLINNTNSGYVIPVEKIKTVNTYNNQCHVVIYLKNDCKIDIDLEVPNVYTIF